MTIEEFLEEHDDKDFRIASIRRDRDFRDDRWRYTVAVANTWWLSLVVKAHTISDALDEAHRRIIALRKMGTQDLTTIDKGEAGGGAR